MTEIQRLAAAIKTISEVYLGRVVKSGDRDGIAKWSLRLADYSTRLAVLVSPPLAMREAAEVEAEPLSKDPSIAMHQILAATGHPVKVGPAGEVYAIDPAGVIADATPQQNRELALLGFFGNDVTTPGIDWSLFLHYYQPDTSGNNDGGWTPKPQYDATGGAWQSYLAGVE
jgi:hypothetical protein